MAVHFQTLVLLQAGMDEFQAAAKVEEAAPAMAGWLRAFVRPQPQATVSMGPGFGGQATNALCIQVGAGLLPSVLWHRP